MVGGLADWFAVTALFRHPLGLPIPHTAIIPRNKDRIGDTLAAFLRDNFLTPSVVARRMRERRRRRRGRPLPRPAAGARRTAARRARSRLIADLLESLDQERLGGMVKSAVAAADAQRSRSRLCSARRSRRRSPTSATSRSSISIVTWAGRTLDANEDLIRDMVHQRAGWILRLAGLDEKLADAIVDGLRRLTIDMAVDPHHPLARQGRGGARHARLGPAARSRDAGQGRGLEERDRRQSRRSPTGSAALWENSRAGLLKARARSRGGDGRPFGEALRQLGETLQQEPRLKARDQPVRPPRHGRHGRHLWRRHRHPGLRDGPRLGRAHRHRTGWKARSAATCNISGSTAPWSAAWSASSSTRSRC